MLWATIEKWVASDEKWEGKDIKGEVEIVQDIYWYPRSICALHSTCLSNSDLDNQLCVAYCEIMVRKLPNSLFISLCKSSLAYFDGPFSLILQEHDSYITSVVDRLEASTLFMVGNQGETIDEPCIYGYEAKFGDVSKKDIGKSSWGGGW